MAGNLQALNFNNPAETARQVERVSMLLAQNINNLIEKPGAAYCSEAAQSIIGRVFKDLQSLQDQGVAAARANGKPICRADRNACLNELPESLANQARILNDALFAGLKAMRDSLGKALAEANADFEVDA